MVTFRITECENPVTILPKSRRLVPGQTLRWVTKDGVPYPIRRRGGYQSKASLYQKGEEKCYLVGCGKCQICDDERVNSKKAKWIRRLVGMIQQFGDYGIETWNRGKVKRIPPGDVFFMTLTVSNDVYPGAAWIRLSDTDVKYLNGIPAFRERSYRECKRLFQQLTHNLRAYRGVKYVVFVEWGLQNTNRIHFHVFFFVPGSVQDGSDWCHSFLDCWREYTCTTQGEFRVIDSAGMAAAYAAKYANKVLGNHRLMSSQFNWSDYESKFACDMHGLDVSSYVVRTISGYRKMSYKGGSEKWRVVQEKYPLSLVTEGAGLEGLKEQLYKYKEGLSVEGVLELDRPGFVYKGGRVCDLNDDNILREIFKSPRSLAPGCYLKLVPCSRHRLQKLRAKALEVINRFSALPKPIMVVLYELFNVSVYGLDLLYRVCVAVSNSLRKRFTASTPPVQST